MANAMYYSAAFHVGLVNARTPLGTLTLATSGKTSIVVDLSTLTGTDFNGNASQFFWHFFTTAGFSIGGHDPNSTTRYRHYSTIAFGRAVQNAINALATTHTWTASDFVVTWLEDAGGFVGALPFYRISSVANNYTRTFSTLAGARMFGHNSTSTSVSAGTHNFSAPPYFVVFPSAQAVSATEELPAIDYEARGIASFVQSDNGMGYGNARLAAPMHREWLQQFEPLSKVQRYRATAPGWTHQDLFEHCRSVFPFFVAHGQFGTAHEYEVFVLRDDGNSWNPQRPSIANNAWLHVPYKTVSIGRIVVDS